MSHFFIVQKHFWGKNTKVWLQNIMEITKKLKTIQHKCSPVCHFMWLKKQVGAALGWFSGIHISVMRVGCEPLHRAVPENTHSYSLTHTYNNWHFFSFFNRPTFDAEMNVTFADCIKTISPLSLIKRGSWRCAYLWYFWPFLLWYSLSSTVHTAPFPPSTRTKHLWRLRLWRTAFWVKKHRYKKNI